MPRFVLTLLMITLCLNLHAATRLGLHYRLGYEPGGGKAKAVLLKWQYRGQGRLVTDSFLLKGRQDLLHAMEVQDGFDPESLYVQVWTADGRRMLQQFFCGAALEAGVGDGYHNARPFGGQACVEPDGAGRGTLCAAVDVIAARAEGSLQYIRYEGGHWSRPFEIYCEYGTDHKEAALKLSIPKAMGWQQKDADCRWYQSTDKGRTWVFADTGRELYPALSSYHGKLLFGVDLWYRVEVAGLKYWPGHSAHSESFGRVKFFLGMRADSLVLSGNAAAHTANIAFWFADDTGRKYGTAPAIFLFHKPAGSLQEQRYRLDTFVNHSPILLGGMPFVNQSRGNQRFYLHPEPGTYRLMYDFTQWNGFDCKLQDLWFEFPRQGDVAAVVHGAGEEAGVASVARHHALIQKFEVFPNPNDGEHFRIRVTLRDTADIRVYKTDPVTGAVLGTVLKHGSRVYEFGAFAASYGNAIYYLRLIASNESRVIKVVAVH